MNTRAGSAPVRARQDWPGPGSEVFERRYTFRAPAPMTAGIRKDGSVTSRPMTGEQAYTFRATSRARQSEADRLLKAAGFSPDGTTLAQARSNKRAPASEHRSRSRTSSRTVVPQSDLVARWDEENRRMIAERRERDLIQAANAVLPSFTGLR